MSEQAHDANEKRRRVRDMAREIAKDSIVTDACARLIEQVVTEVHAACAAKAQPNQSRAIADVIAERRRQVESEGFDETHDMAHRNGERWHADEAARQRDVWKARAEAAEARVTAIEAEKAGAIKLADGYGIVLMMIAAGCSDPQRFAQRMLAEYEAEAKKMEAKK